MQPTVFLSRGLGVRRCTHSVLHYADYNLRDLWNIRVVVGESVTIEMEFHIVFVNQEAFVSTLN